MVISVAIVEIALLVAIDVDLEIMTPDTHDVIIKKHVSTAKETIMHAQKNVYFTHTTHRYVCFK